MERLNPLHLKQVVKKRVVILYVIPVEFLCLGMTIYWLSIPEMHINFIRSYMLAILTM